MKKIFGYSWIFIVILFLYLPILIMAVYSFTDSTMIGSIRNFSLDNYITLFTKQELVDMIWGSVLLSLGVGLLSTFLGTLGAVGTFYAKRKTNMTINMINQIPVVNADVVTGFSICILFVVFLQMDKSTFIPLILGQTTLCTPFVYLSVLPKLQQMDKYLYDAALDLGCNDVQAFFKVVLREIIPGIISGFMISITLSLDDYFITTYTKPAVFDTISTYVVNATKGAQTTIKTALWALSTLVFLVAIIIVVIANISHKKTKKR